MYSFPSSRLVSSRLAFRSSACLALPLLDDPPGSSRHRSGIHLHLAARSGRRRYKRLRKPVTISRPVYRYTTCLHPLGSRPVFNLDGLRPPGRVTNITVLPTLRTRWPRHIDDGDDKRSRCPPARLRARRRYEALDLAREPRLRSPTFDSFAPGYEPTLVVCVSHTNTFSYLCRFPRHDSASPRNLIVSFESSPVYRSRQQTRRLSTHTHSRHSQSFLLFIPFPPLCHKAVDCLWRHPRPFLPSACPAESKNHLWRSHHATPQPRSPGPTQAWTCA